MYRARSAIGVSRGSGLSSYRPKSSGHPKQIKTTARLLSEAKKPLVLAGGGVNLSEANDELNKFLNKHKIPVATTLMGHGINPGDERLFCGFVGMHEPSMPT